MSTEEEKQITKIPQQIQDDLAECSTNRRVDHDKFREMEETIEKRIEQYRQDPRYTRWADQLEKELERIRMQADQCFEDSLTLLRKTAEEMASNSRRETTQVVQDIEEKKKPKPQPVYSFPVFGRNLVFMTYKELILAVIMLFFAILFLSAKLKLRLL